VLGGGRSLYKDGPGSGVTSRFNRNVVEPNSNTVHSVSTSHVSYSDSGLFVVEALTERGRTDEVINLLTAELARSRKVSEDEFKRARRMFEAEFVRRHEQRDRQLELVAHQASSGAQLQSPAEYIKAKMTSVSANDVSSAAAKLLSSRPTLVVIGDVDGATSADSIAASLS
jgi:predicted Zn-dependent peptidase